MKRLRAHWFLALVLFLARPSINLGPNLIPHLSSGSACFGRSHSRIDGSAGKKVVYYCPMHPDYRSDTPGKCPRCGMELKTGTSDSIPASVSLRDELKGSAKGNELGSGGSFKIPDTPVLDQNGKQLRFYSDLIKGKTVAIDFIFTTCTTICPPLTATLRKVQSNLGDRIGKDISLISITVDPVTDTPERLKDFASKFQAQPGWTFVTGSKADIDKLLVALGGYSGNPSNHSPIILIGNDAARNWTRTYGLAPPTKLTQMIEDAAAKGKSDPVVSDSRREEPPREVQALDSRFATSSRNVESGSSSKASGPTIATRRKTPGEFAAGYFPDKVLITQTGQPVHFYSDLVKDKVVVIDFMFTTCTGICPAATANLAKVRRYLEGHVGKDVNMISISVDPQTDTPEKLKEYAAQYKTGPGWYFLTGERSNVETVLHKLGGYVEDPNDHSTFVIVGNPQTGEWAKVFAMAPPSTISALVTRLVNETPKDTVSKVDPAN